MYRLKNNISFLVLLYAILISSIIQISACVLAEPSQDSKFKISGFVDADLQYTNQSLRSGFLIEVAGYSLHTLSDNRGYFEINNVPSNSSGYTIKISKSNYLKRDSQNIIVNSDIQLGNENEPIKMWAGDIKKDGLQDNAINISDVVVLAKYYNSTSSDEKYNTDCDLNGDGAINMSDVIVLAKHFNGIPSDYPQMKITTSLGEAIKIEITKAMLINESVSGDAFLLFDENDIAGDTPSIKPVNSWRVSGESFYHPANVIVDLGQPYEITDIYYFDGPNSAYTNGYGYKEVDGGIFRVSAGTPFHWDDELFTYTLSNNSTWKMSSKLNCTTQYLQLSKIPTKEYYWSTHGPYKCDANITEVVIYGKPIGTKPPKPTPLPTPDFNITVGSFIGANVFTWDRPETFTNIGFAREYHDWDKTDDMKYPNNTCMFWSDSWYKTVSESGIIINLNLKSNTSYTDVTKPAKGPTTDPRSYASHADHMFQIGARYGSTIVPSYLLKVQDNNKKTGLNYVKYFEDWNEPNNWWAGASSNFSPYEYAAMASADYDGHCKTMGTTVGLKNADPNAKFVMAGIAEMSLDWVKACDLWFREFRPDHKPIFDVLNFHHYCQANNTGISPEADKMKEKLKELVDYRNQNYPDKEIWLSEFGWDTNNNSTQRAVPHAGFSMYEVQGQWLIRGYLAAIAAGIDRVNMYMLDENNSSTSAGLYETCGLLDSSGNKKVSWYYVSTMKNRLNTMKYIGEMDTGNLNVTAYRFKDVNSQKGAYVIWCPTSDGTSVKDFKLSLPEGTTSATLVTMQDKSNAGLESTLAVTNNTVTINVSETPVYIMVNKI